MSAAVRWWGFGLLMASLWVLSQLMPILSPFLVAMFLAYLGDPLVDRFERMGLSRTGGTLVVFCLLLVGCLAVLLVLVPLLGQQLVDLYQLTPQVLDWLQQTALPWVQSKLGLKEFWDFDQIREAVSSHLESTTDLLTVILTHLTRSGLAVLAWFGNILLIPVVVFYLMRDWPVILQRVRALLPRHREDYLVGLIQECHEVLRAFLRGQLMVVLVLMLVYAVGLMFIGLNLGLLIGFLAGLASIVPYMGFVSGIIAALVAALFQFGWAFYPLLGVAVVFAIGQLLETMVLVPWLVGDRIGLHPVAVIFAILAGGQLFGFTGILLALPVTAVVMVLLRHLHELYRYSSLYSGPANK